MSQERLEQGNGGVSPQLIRNAVEIAIRLGAIGLLVGWCLMIVAPFLGIVVWALIIAIGLDGPFERLCRALGGRRVWAGIIVVFIALLLLFGPAVLLSETLVSGAKQFSHELTEGKIQIPPPQPWVRDLPVIGSRAYEGWLHASQNLGETLMRLEPQLRTVSQWLLKAAGEVGAGLLQLIGSILIAGVMLVRSRTRRETVERFALRMAGETRGPELATLATATVRSVVQGILGVAAIQALLAGLGFLVAGIPGAGLWALLVLVSAIVQVPVLFAMVPAIVIGFSSLGGPAAFALLAWCLLVGLVDNVLKPILFGRGAKVPMLVIFVGSIGGMLTMGIVGLFLGSVVLALGFALFMAWLSGPAASSDAGPQVESSASRPAGSLGS